jgi:hypothetical protein
MRRRRGNGGRFLDWPIDARDRVDRRALRTAGTPALSAIGCLEFVTTTVALKTNRHAAFLELRHGKRHHRGTSFLEKHPDDEPLS